MSSRRSKWSDSFARQLYRPKRGESIIKGRILGPLGDYPNIAMELGPVQYVPFHGIPLLITQEEHSEADTELGYLSEYELMAAASILLADEAPRFHLYFESGNEVTIARAAVNAIPTAERHALLYELLAFTIRPHNQREVFQPPTSALTPGQYAFAPMHFAQEATALFAAFAPHDELLLRTVFMLQKARMLWLNHVFSEDALANVFFALEGCLLLLQRKSGGSPSKIDLTLLTKLFTDLFPRGEELFEFVQEAYDKRIEIVHPSPASGPKWQPFLMAEEFYDYFGIARRLLNRIMIDREIETERLI